MTVRPETPPRRTLETVAAFVLLSVAAGCATSGVTARFAERPPLTIAVASVEDRTGQALESVDFAGIGERMVGGGQPVNVSDVLAGALRAALAQLGYDVVDDSSAADAILVTRIDRWRAGRGGGATFEIGFDVDLRRRADGERLYAGRGRAIQRGMPAERNFGDVANALDRAARAALAGLPPRSGGSGS